MLSRLTSIISSTASNAYSHMPSFRLSTPKEVANKVKVCALGTLAVLALGQTQKADAGPVSFAACVAICTAETLGAFIPLCIAACAALFPTPTP